ncbi:MAG TPA: diphosphomevalonate decarboxylase [Moheibacter sp.]|nr:diphosphomevalonate decarboxylase [Moheibacter sp.]
MNQFQSKLNLETSTEKGSVKAKCASNIALVKYWGKRDIQIPMNPSISFTLNNSYTESELRFTPKSTNEFLVNVYLDSQLNEHFAPRIYTFFERIESYIPFLRNFEFEIHTHNTFPHSSGIASSASGMGALALCLVDLEEKLGAEFNENEKLQKASFLARLGSGSACRSVYPGLAVWGKSEFVEGSSDLYAIPYPYEVHENFRNFRDTILLIDEGQKKVSSSLGHKLMNNHPYAKKRFESADENLGKLIQALKEGNLEEFGELVEHEALSLHAMMMTSFPSFILMKPNTVAAIEKVRKFREQSGANIYFTLDAGANVHLLYPEYEENKCFNFIESQLQSLCASGKLIKDFSNS